MPTIGKFGQCGGNSRAHNSGGDLPLVCLICPLLLVNASDWFSLKGEFSSLALCMQTPFFCLLILEPKWSQLMCQMANTYLLKHYFVHQALNNAMLFYYWKAFYIYNVKGRKFLSGNCQHLCFGICSKMCNDCGCLYIIYSYTVGFFTLPLNQVTARLMRDGVFFAL